MSSSKPARSPRFPVSISHAAPATIRPAAALPGSSIGRSCSTAAQTMRAALDRRGLTISRSASRWSRNRDRQFCQNGAPPPGVDYIAAHPYCDFVADLPPMWTTLSGAECWEQARNQEFGDRSKGVRRDPHLYRRDRLQQRMPFERRTKTMLNGRGAISFAPWSRPNRLAMASPTRPPFPDFLFEFGDVCPPGGCLAGCGDPQQCSYNCCCQHQCSAQAVCGAGCPACVGNGYFGLFHTPGYGTDGFPPEPKFDPMPSLLCPASQK